MAKVFLSGPLYDVMVKKKYDPQKLANHSGCERRAIIRLLRGETSNLLKGTRKYVAKALGLSPEELDRLIHQQVQFGKTQMLLRPLYYLAKYAALGIPEAKELKKAQITRQEVQSLRDRLDRALQQWPEPKKKKLTIPALPSSS